MIGFTNTSMVIIDMKSPPGSLYSSAIAHVVWNTRYNIAAAGEIVKKYRMLGLWIVGEYRNVIRRWRRGSDGFIGH
ncbi:MAG TPA: hypothetical protein VKY45_04470 [Marinilabiliaceae bacterium]|nr:hypothetical protein [Marinilabiliaceae bacterium]